MSEPDLFTNRLGNVLVAAPSLTGSLAGFGSQRQVALERGTGQVGPALARWIFADLPQGTLRDQWGNPYDHAAHTLIVGNLAEGEAFIAELVEAGVEVEEADNLFVPFQTVKVDDVADSDALRERHPRSFALAIRRLPDLRRLITSVRDAVSLGV